MNSGLISHSDNFSQHSGIKTYRINCEIFKERRENVILIRIAVQNKVKNLMTICSNSNVTLISENWSINLVLLLFKIFVMRTWNNKSCKLLMVCKEIKHDLLVFFGIAELIISQRFVLEKFQLIDRVKVIARFVNKNFFIILNVLIVLWRTS